MIYRLVRALKKKIWRRRLYRFEDPVFIDTRTGERLDTLAMLLRMAYGTEVPFVKLLSAMLQSKQPTPLPPFDWAWVVDLDETVDKWLKQ